jgi:glutamate synthase (NADPH/NADH) small chain
MNASDYEQELAQTDGVLIRHWMKPVALHAENGRLTGVRLEYTREVNGRLEGTGETIDLPCDQLFKAIGQKFALDGWAKDLALEAGRIWVDASRKTSLANVWAGGDCIAGGKDLTVAAVEDGKQAALAINAFLKA